MNPDHPLDECCQNDSDLTLSHAAEAKAAFPAPTEGFPDDVGVTRRGVSPSEQMHRKDSAAIDPPGVPAVAGHELVGCQAVNRGTRW